MEELENDLKAFLDVDESDKILPILLRQAKRNVVSKRYPFGATDTEKEKAYTQYENVIFDAVVYAFNKQGAEGQSAHSENGINRSYIDESSLYDDIVPVAKCL